MLHIMKTQFSPWLVHYSKLLARTLKILPAAATKTNTTQQSGNDKIIRSERILDKPLPETSFYEFITAGFHEFQNKPALIDGLSGEKLSYTQLHLLSKKFGSLLTKHGLKESDCVAIYSPNCIQYPVPLIGNAGIGAITTTANPLLTKHELANQLKDCKAKYLVTKNVFLDNARAAADLAGIDKIILFDEPDKQENGVFGWNKIIEDDGSAFIPQKQINAKDQVLFLPYSSGTTGKPKGVMQTHYNVVSNVIMLQNAHALEASHRERCLGILPFFHTYGMAVVISYNLWEGKTVVSLPKFEPETFLAAFTDYKVDYANLVPPLFIFLTKHPLVDKYDLTSLRTVTSGAAPLANEAYYAFRDKFPHVDFVQGFAMTESILATICSSTMVDAKPGSVGTAFANTELKVMNVETGDLLGPNETGEIHVRSPSIMKGYLNNPESSKKCISEDGWLASGDLGYYDEDNHFYIVERIKELIKYKAYQVPPAELEDLLLSHPKVADVAVIGIPDEEAGELPRAYVVKKGEVSDEELITFVKEHVAPHKRLRGGVEFIGVIPKTASGKILRRVLKDKLAKEA